MDLKNFNNGTIFKNSMNMKVNDRIIRTDTSFYVPLEQSNKLFETDY